MNTSPRAQMEGRGQYNPVTQAFEIRTLAPVSNGSQLYLTYGNFSNREHVLFYGYFVPKCLNDSCALYVASFVHYLVVRDCERGLALSLSD